MCPSTGRTGSLARHSRAVCKLCQACCDCSSNAGWLQPLSLTTFSASHRSWLGHAGTQILERLDLDDSLIGHQHMAANPDAPDTAFHSALAASPERMVLLTTQGNPASL